MNPPEAPLPNDPVGQGAPPAGHLRLETLKARADFLRTARAKRVVTPGFVLQYRLRGEGETIRVGFTCSKKVGNAVARNRAKRRLREIARLILPEHGRSGTDYVLIGRAEVTANRPFDAMLDDLSDALSRAR
ncbi:MAG: ribonuclease P protein component [Pseudomonadota bacterium]